MDVPFILRNYAGLLFARLLEIHPQWIDRLAKSRSPLKPWIAARLRGDHFRIRRDVVVGDVTLCARLDDDVQRMIFLGLYEPEELRLSRPFVKDGGSCIDLGATVGWFTLHLGRWVGSKGRVISVEADPMVAGELRANIRLNQLDEIVHVVDAAAGNSVGEISFIQSSSEHSGWGSAMERPENDGTTRITVAQTTLDKLVEEHQLKSVDFLKIDVEGYEFAVLEGAGDSLRRGVFRNVMIEWLGVAHTRNGRTIDELLNIFLSAGYRAHDCIKQQLSDWSTGKADPKTSFTNLFFTVAEQ